MSDLCDYRPDLFSSIIKWQRKTISQGTCNFGIRNISLDWNLVRNCQIGQRWNLLHTVQLWTWTEVEIRLDSKCLLVRTSSPFTETHRFPGKTSFLHLKALQCGFSPGFLSLCNKYHISCWSFLLSFDRIDLTRSIRFLKSLEGEMLSTLLLAIGKDSVTICLTESSARVIWFIKGLSSSTFKTLR